MPLLYVADQVHIIRGLLNNVVNLGAVATEQLVTNLRFLRRSRGMTQQQFADLLGIKRPSVGAYEEARAKPGFATLNVVCREFGLTLDNLINTDVEGDIVGNRRSTRAQLPDSHIRGDNMRVLAITTDDNNNEKVVLVPQKAAAGYLAGYADPEFVTELPAIDVPGLQGASHRAFEIQGDSMPPLNPGSIVICEYVTDWYEIKDGLTYVVLSRDDGIVYKRAVNRIKETRELVLHSDNPAYPPFIVPADNILEVWRAVAFISKTLSGADASVMKLAEMVMGLQQEVQEIRQQKPGA